MKIAVVDNPTVVWRLLHREPREYPQKPYIARNYVNVLYIFFRRQYGSMFV